MLRILANLEADLMGGREKEKESKAREEEKSPYLLSHSNTLNLEGHRKAVGSND